MNIFIFILIFFSCVSVCSSFYFVSWGELHSVKNVEEFHYNVKRVVEEFACEDCRKHFEDLVNTHPIPVDMVTTVDEARIWMWIAHNMVNVRIGKPWAPYSILEQYSGSCNL